MTIDFNKGGGLIPVIIQNHTTYEVLMLGYMNEEAWAQTQQEGRVTFYSRNKDRLWTKGETSGNYLQVHCWSLDCDGDTLLIQVTPAGPTCHTGADTCFGDSGAKGFLYELEATIKQRIDDDVSQSYTRELFSKGINKVAQKVGEEAVELVIEAMDNNLDLFKGEAADLLYHYLILIKCKGLTMSDIEAVLKQRAR